MSFMKPEIVFELFEIFETKEGTVCLPEGVITLDEILKELGDDNDPYHPFTIEQAKELGLYELKEGWFARLSAPGYMDATDWSGPFDSEEEAKQYLNYTYGSDDDSD